MASENLKQISAKIDPVTLDKLDNIQRQHYYWKRNTIINGILTAVVDTFTIQEIYDMIRYCRIIDYETEGSFKLITSIE